MNCSKCGSQTLPSQKFCRSCGASLEIITQPLAERGVGSALEERSAAIPKDKQPRTSTWMLWAVTIMFIGVAMGIIGKKLMHEEIVTVLGVLISLAGMFLTVYPYLAPSYHHKSESGSSSQSQEIPTPPATPKHLPQESYIEPVPSITERTTDLLKSPVATRRK